MKKIKNKYLGISAYALMHEKFPVDAFLKAFPKPVGNLLYFYPATAILWGSFGDKLENVKAFCDKFADRPHFLEVHISNECARGRGANERQILPRYNTRQYGRMLTNINSRAIKAVCSRTKEILLAMQKVKNANTELCLSPGLEVKYPPDEALKNLYVCTNEAIASTPYSAQVVLSYVSASGMPCQYKALPIEGHGLSPLVHDRPYKVANMDGISLYCNDHEKFMSQITFKKSYMESVLNHYVVLLWHAQLQGLSGMMEHSDYTPCKERVFKMSSKACRYTRKLLHDMYMHTL